MRDIAAGLKRYIDTHAGAASYGHPGYWENYLLPSPFNFTAHDVEGLAAYLLEDADFQAIRLGTWLGTPEGKTVAWVVNEALPPIYRPYAKFFEQAIMRAAQLQHDGKVEESGKYVVGALAVAGAGIVAWLLNSGG